MQLSSYAATSLVITPFPYCCTRHGIKSDQRCLDHKKPEQLQFSFLKDVLQYEPDAAAVHALIMWSPQQRSVGLGHSVNKENSSI